jgi:hypothetical protein
VYACNAHGLTGVRLIRSVPEGTSETTKNHLTPHLLNETLNALKTLCIQILAQAYGSR